MISFSHLPHCQQIIDLKSIDLTLERRIITDTRDFVTNEAFIAIPGQKVNPLNLIVDLLKRGLDIVFYQHTTENAQIVNAHQKQYPDVRFIPVKDSVAFIQELTHQHIQEWLKNKSNTLFAISGSNGKTTHKEMLSYIMEDILPGQVVYTKKNNNNHLGVPLTLLEVGEETKFVVLELGSNHPGEIKFLCDLALPNAGLTTNIGATHLEFFGTEKEVFLEEGYLYYAVKENTRGQGFYLINNNDQFLKTLKDTQGSKRFGDHSDSELVMSFFEDGAKMNEVEVHNPHITGKHNKANLVTCAYVAIHFYPQFREQIIQAASRFRPTANRSQWIEKNGSKIFLDAYNANPSSMKVALEGFRDHMISQGLALDKSCVILGDMNELGENSARYHRETGSFAAQLGFTNIFFVGRFAGDYFQGAGEGRCYPDVAALRALYQQEFLTKFPYHFIKGSRSLQLESLFDIT